MVRLVNFLKSTAILGIASTTLGAGLAYAAVDFTSTNDTTGARSENFSRVLANRDWNIDWQDNSTIDNEVRSNISTGFNDLSRNTTAGGQSTGTIGLLSNLGGGLQNGLSGFGLGNNIFGGGFSTNGNITATSSNAITGANSENTNIIDSSQNFRLNVDNQARVQNDSFMRLDTGNNRTNRNTTVGDVSTGEIVGMTNFSNGSVNNPLSNIDFSGLNTGTVSADFSNGTTGFNSTNENILDANSEVDINIENNSTIENDFEVWANTGGNDTNENTTVGDVTTGSVTIDMSAIQ